jgi:beta-hydroxyacyl-ACP dehydratase FabZ
MTDMLDFLPHRYPFLMVDKVVKVDDERIVAIKNVSNNESYFQGHFPNNPIMPGVFILEAMFQAGGLLSMSRTGPPETTIAYLTQITKAQFKNPVIPGDHLYVTVSILANMGSAYKFTGKADVSGVMVAEASWMSMVPKKEK